MRALNCLSDLKTLLTKKEIKIDSFDGLKLKFKGKTVGYVSVLDKWNVYKDNELRSYNTKDLLNEIDNIIEE